MSSRLPRPVAVVAAVAVVLTGACGVPAAAPAAPPLTWTTCADDAALQCATLTVPLDRDDPADGRSVTLPVVKVPAGDPDRRLGAVVLNRGGPGYGVLDYLTGIRSGTLVDPLRPAVYERYDVIALDQRGAGGSQPAVRCAATPEEGAAFAAAAPGLPLDDAERAVRAEADAAFAQRCRDESGDLLDHVSTVEAARDLDVLRAALGEPRLSFVGQSYGTFLGSVYANLFPDRVGRFVLDSVIDPVAVDGPEALRSARIGSDTASAAALAEFFRLCAAGGERCGFGAGDPAGAFERLAEQLRANPVVLAGPGGEPVPFGLAELVTWTGAWLYQPMWWEEVGYGASFLALAERAAVDPAGPEGAFVGSLLVGLRTAGLLGAPYDGPINATFAAVNCVDNVQPADRVSFDAALQAREADVPLFGALRGLDDAVCASWTAADDIYPGPWDATTPEPILIMNSRFDPVTPLAAAQRLQARLPGSALLVNEGWGHVTVQQSGCMIDAASAYLVDGVLPAPGATCAPDRVPFS